jgi:soluble lytic murein transglycosylase
VRFGVLILILVSSCFATNSSQSRREAEYYVATYAQHYGIPTDFVRAIVEHESGWRRCAVSAKGAVGLMQLMPGTARQLNVSHRCDVNENVSGGVRLLAWLSRRFHGDLRLVAAAYYAGVRIVKLRGLSYANPDVVRYVVSVRAGVGDQRNFPKSNLKHIQGRTR